MGIVLELPKVDEATEVVALGQEVSAQEGGATRQSDVQQEVAQALKEAERLSPEEKSMVDDFARQIDLNNATMMLHYGTNAQKKLGVFSNIALKGVQGRDVGEIGELLAEMSTEIEKFNQNVEKAPLRLFLSAKRKQDKLTARYEQVSKTLDRIVKELEGQKISLEVDIKMLEQTYEQNLEHLRELTMYILAGKQKLAEVRGGELMDLHSQAKQSGLHEDALACSDLEAQCNNFEKRLHDLELTRQICLQTAPQIRLVQQTDQDLLLKIQSSIDNTLPLWRNKMMIGLAIDRQSQASEAQRTITDLTNAMLKDNAERLHTSVVNATKEAERGVIDVETVETSNRELIATIKEVLTIQDNGRKQRQIAEARLQQAEDELKNALIGRN